jgi:hypothetical protein
MTAKNAVSLAFFYKAGPNYPSGPDTYKLDLLDTCTDKLDPKIFLPYPLWKILPPIPPSDYPNDLSGLVQGVQSNGVATSRKHTEAYNLIKKVVGCKGDVWALIPRVKDGYCWVAKIRCNRNYEIWPQKSSWLKALDTELSNNLKSSTPSERYIFLADAAQGWKTSDWREVSFLRFPRWFSKQFLSQSSFGEIRSNSLAPPLCFDSPAQIAEDCWKYPTKSVTLTPTTNIIDIQKRLVERLSPTALEFLCVELLNLKCPKNLFWVHVGGVGDGGNDGIGFDLNGNPKEFLSVKWQINIDTPVNKRAIIAYLVGNPPLVQTHHAMWDSKGIATDVLNHRMNISVSFRKLLGV